MSVRTPRTAWQIDFAPQLATYGLPTAIYLYTLSDNCEVISIAKSGAFFEGAAFVLADREKTRPIGHGFVEQMGFD